jgi:hypothetical protein
VAGRARGGQAVRALAEKAQQGALAGDGPQRQRHEQTRQ